MTTRLRPADELAHRVEAFEAAAAADPTADLGAFLPAPDHPLYLPVLAELIRVDLERANARREPRRLDAYLGRFPAAFADPAALAELAFEEYRQRRLAGEPVAPDEYARRYGLDAAGWPAIAPGSVALPASGRVRPAATDEPTRLRPAPAPASVSAAPADASRTPTLALRGGVPVPVPVASAGVLRLPDVGDRFLDFRLLRLLGRGAFGRVFLAHQGDLADRPVALKITARSGSEHRTLARLQHTHIVPIHSVHRTADHQAVCMPYLGGTTLAAYVARLSARPTLPGTGREFATTLRESAAPAEPVAGQPAPAAPPLAELARGSYVDAVLGIGARLADALAHAHARGVLHCDIKPANVLITDEGRPMLLDFNVARGGDDPADALVGGTVPYMAPEQLREYLGRREAVGPAADVYALGLVLYELLGGVPAFALDRDPAAALAARAAPPRSLRLLNRRVGPAADAVVRRCLRPDPADRYPSAQALAEDLDRHLADLPLRHTPEPSPAERARKWTRRNRWVRSPFTLAAALAAAAMLGTSAWAVRAEGAKLAELGRRHGAASEAFAASRPLFRRAVLTLTALPDEATLRAQAVADGRAALAAYGVPDDAGWRERPGYRDLSADDRAKLARDVDLLAFLLRQATDGGPAGPADLADLGPGDPFAAASAGIAAGRYRQTAAALREQLRAAPEDVGLWYTLGACQARLGAWGEAAAAFSTCVALQPGFSRAYLLRGAALMRGPSDARDYRQARADFDRVLALEPGLVEGYVQRSAAAKALWDYPAAVADLTAALALPDPSVRLYFLRSDARRLAGDAAGADADRAEGLKRTPADDDGWVARGLARVGDDPAGALADFAEAERINPRSLPALQNQAHVLGELLGRDADAVAKLDRLLGWYPEFAFARSGRAVHLARLGRVAEAVADAEECLKASPGPETWYRAGCAYALCAGHDPRHRDAAIRLAARAVAAGFGAGYLPTDADFAPVRDEPEFRRLCDAARTLTGLTR